MRASLLACALVFASLATTAVLAQNDPLPLPPLGISIITNSSRNVGADNSSRVSLLRRPEVQQELSIDAEQLERLRANTKETTDAFQALLPANRDRKTQTPEERQQATDALRKQIELQYEQAGKALEILYAEQRGRLEQLFLQQLGARALMRSDVADEIKLTHAQMDALREMQSGGSDAFGVFNANLGQPRDIRAEMDKRMEESRKRRERFETEGFQVLNDEQRAAWQKLIGPKFMFIAPTRRAAAAPAAPPAPAKPEDATP
ncbi:MAG: hypothetical protein SH850_26300 [Planctomycetaceae bacterium]|nr:hypothetical protein [Planctomycetaceae bacterium]